MSLFLPYFWRSFDRVEALLETLLLLAALAVSAGLLAALRRKEAAHRKQMDRRETQHRRETAACQDALLTQRQEMEDGAQSLSQANDLLAQASSRFQELFQGLPVACACYDVRGRVMEWNRAFASLYALDNPLGRPRTDAAAFAEAFEAALVGDAQEGIEWTHHGEDGDPVQVQSSVFPLRGVDGSVTGVISADTDISAQHAAEEALRHSEERLHALYNTTSQPQLTFEDKTSALLEMGRAQFGLEIGVLACVRGQNYEVRQAQSPEDSIPAGLTLPVSGTYCAEVLAKADAVHFEEAGSTARRESPVYKTFGLEAYLGAPVRVSGEVWGMLCFAGRQAYPRLFTSGDRELVRLMAQWIGGEVARQQAEAAVRDSEERFRTAIAAMSEGLIVMDGGGMIRLWNDSAERILGKTQGEMRGWQPLNPEFMAVREDGSRFPEGSYPLMVSLRRGETQRDVVMGLPRSGGGLIWVSVNAKPLFGDSPDTPVAVVATFSDVTERRRAEEQIAAQMTQIQDYAVVLESKAQELETLNIELEALALHDGLTGLSNRRAFGHRISLEISRAARYGHPLSLLLLDVDAFKDYNDTYGHVAGDEVLRHLAQVMEAQGRETDFYARYGGEEFVVILPSTDAEGTLVVAERLRILVEEETWPGRPVTISLGAATLQPSMQNEDEFICAADRALYAAKNAGRNRSVHFSAVAQEAQWAGDAEGDVILSLAA